MNFFFVIYLTHSVLLQMILNIPFKAIRNFKNLLDNLSVEYTANWLV